MASKSEKILRSAHKLADQAAQSSAQSVVSVATHHCVRVANKEDENTQNAYRMIMPKRVQNQPYRGERNRIQLQSLATIKERLGAMSFGKFRSERNVTKSIALYSISKNSPGSKRVDRAGLRYLGVFGCRANTVYMYLNVAKNVERKREKYDEIRARRTFLSRNLVHPK